MLKIIGGQYGSRRLQSAPGRNTRPSAARLREALFSILEARGLVEDANVLDVFAGSGALGLEALSRQARFCTFVEKEASALKALNGNIDALSLQAQSLVIKGDFHRPLTAEFDLIIADPPYDCGLVARVLNWVVDNQLLAAGGCLVVEHSLQEEAGSNALLVLSDQRRYGQSRISFFEHIKG